MPQRPNAYLCGCTLGRFHVCIDGRSVLRTGAAGSKTWSVFQFLLTYRGEPVSEQAICKGLWPGSPVPRARRALHHVMYRLERQLQEGGLHAPVFVVQDGMYSFNEKLDYWIDADRFEKLCRQARRKVESDRSSALECMQEAVELYRGRYLAEHFYDDWAKAEQQRFHSVYMDTVLSYADLLIEAGNYEQARQVCETALALEPTDEDLARRVVSAYIQEGNLSKAKTAYQKFAAVLYHENGIQPSQRLRQLWEDMEADRGEIPASDLPAVQEALGGTDVPAGPLFCNFQCFRRMYELECRQLRQSGGSSAYLVRVELAAKAASPLPSDPELLRSAEVLHSALEDSLHREESVCRIQDEQFLLLLSSAHPHSAVNTIHRIKRRYGRRYAGPVTLRTEESVIVPQEPRLDRVGGDDQRA